MDEIGLSSALFSNVQQRVLALIFGHTERSFYTSEIVRNIRSGTGKQWDHAATTGTHAKITQFIYSRC